LKIKVEKLDEVYVRVFSEASIEAELVDFFTYEYPGARFTPQYKARLWDGKYRLYDQIRKTLYVGLVNYVVEFAKRNGYDYELSDDLKLQGGISKDHIEGFVLSLNPSSRGKAISVRDYQLDAIYSAITRERVLLLSPTASGKSLIIYSTVRHHLEYDRKIILIVPTTSLVEQMFADFEDYSSANGWNTEQQCQKLYSGFPKDFTRSVLITTWQSVYKQPKNWFRQFNVMFGDEAHQFKAKSLIDTMGKMDEIQYRIGTTGTLDNKKVHRLTLEGIFGPVHRVTTTKKLMDSGRLTDLNIQCLMLQYPEEIRRLNKKMTYQDEMNFIVGDEKRNKFIRNLAVNLNGNTLVLFQYVKKHGLPLYEDIMEKAKGTGKLVFFVSGDTVVKEREQIREVARDIDNCIIVASYGTFSTGINIPSIENIIFASPSKSKIRNLQSIGRGLRLKDGKQHCNLYDLADDLHWKSKKNHTLNHAAERYKTYAEEEFKIKMVEVKLYGN
jgi:superfamily II DNA or RNA helicase